MPSPPVAGCRPALAIARPVSTEQETPSPSVPVALSVISGLVRVGLVLLLQRRLQRPQCVSVHGWRVRDQVCSTRSWPNAWCGASLLEREALRARRCGGRRAGCRSSTASASCSRAGGRAGSTSSTSLAPRPRPRALRLDEQRAQLGRGRRRRARTARRRRARRRPRRSTRGRCSGSKSAAIRATSRSKLVVPAVLAGVEHAVALDQPAEVAGLEAADHGVARGLDRRPAGGCIAAIAASGSGSASSSAPTSSREPSSSVAYASSPVVGQATRWRRASAGEGSAR